MKVYAFDVDETLEISNGPVTLAMVEELRGQGHAVGICGNWGLFCAVVPDWHRRISFVNCIPPAFVQGMAGQGVRVDKAWFLNHLQQYVRAEEYVLVGNRPGRTNSLGVMTHSEDEEAARLAGWKFLLEDDFAGGAR